MVNRLNKSGKTLIFILCLISWNFIYRVLCFQLSFTIKYLFHVSLFHNHCICKTSKTLAAYLGRCINFNDSKILSLPEILDNMVQRFIDRERLRQNHSLLSQLEFYVQKILLIVFMFCDIYFFQDEVDYFLKCVDICGQSKQSYGASHLCRTGK